MFRGLSATAAAASLSLAAAVSVSVAPSAQAAVRCTLNAPAKVKIWNPYTAVGLTASGGCTEDGGFGAWEFTHPSQGLQDLAFFDGTTRDTIDVFDETLLNRHDWRPGEAYDSAGARMRQNVLSTDIRVGSAAGISATRSGTAVTISVRTVRYSTANDINIMYAGATGVIQYRTPGTSTWNAVKTVTTGSNGTTSYRYTTSATRDYRFALYSKSTIWDAVSYTITK